MTECSLQCSASVQLQDEALAVAPTNRMLYRHTWAGRVNLKVNRPKEERKLFIGRRLRVYWLSVQGELPALREYRREVDDTEVQASLKAIDGFLERGERVPSFLTEKWTYANQAVREVKAPKQQAFRIYRLLCYHGRDWDLYVALAREKKRQSIPNNWKDLAVRRIKESLRHGGP
jgi:phage-related protein